jgi:heme A synthase
VARLYRRLVLLVGGQFVLGILINLSGGPDSVSALPLLLALVVALVAVFLGLVITSYRLNRLLGSRAMLRAFGMCIPLVNLGVLRVIDLDAQAWCKRYGIDVGFLGPTNKSLEKLRRADS